jgi:hypothetical protein
MSCQALTSELSSERQNELIEQISQFLVKNGFEDFAQIILQGTSPYGTVVGEFGYMALYPAAVALLGNSGKDLSNLFGFDYKTAADRILIRMDELKKEKEILAKNNKEESRRKKRLGRFSFLLWSRSVSKLESSDRVSIQP